MRHFDKFINEVQTVEIKIKEYYVKNGKIFIDWTPDEVPGYNLPKEKFLDLSHYHQRKSNYDAELKHLQQLAVTDAMNLSPAQLNMHLNRLILLKNKYDKFWTLYKEYLHYDPNYFNEVCYKLFLYLNEKYNKGGKIKYINIFYFLKSITGEMQNIYQFTIKIDDYKSLILKKFQTEIKKFQKAQFAYEEKELPKLKNIQKDFEKSLK